MGLSSRWERLRTAESHRLVSYFTVCAIVAIDFMGLTIQNPLLPFYAKEFSDARDLGVGQATALLMLSYAIAQLIATPVFGFGSDRFGRKPMLLVSVAGSCLGFLGQGFAKSLMSLCILRGVTGLFGGSRPVAMAYVADTVPPEQQAKYTSGIALAVSASMFLAPVLGGSMGLVDLALPCFFQAGMSAIVFLLALRYVVEPKKPNAVQGRRDSGGGSNAKERPYRRWLFLNAMVGGMVMLTLTMWSTVLPVHAEEVLHLDANKIGLLMGSTGLMIALAQFAIFVPASSRCSFPVLGSIGIIILGFICFAPAFQYELWFFMAVSATQGIGASLCIPGVSMTVSLMAPPTKRGGLMSLTIMFQALMRVVAPILAGPLYDRDFTLPIYVIGGALGIALLLELVLIPRVPRVRKQQPALGEKKEEDLSKEDKDEEQERKALLENFYKIREELSTTLTRWRERKAGIEAGKSTEELGLHPVNSMPPEPSLAEKHELGVWFADMLWQHNFKRWKDHPEIVHNFCRNAFPKLRDYPMEWKSRAEDIEHVLESHLMMENQWERFVLQRSAVPLAGTVDFDFVAIAELASVSRTPSEANHSDIDQPVGVYEI